jgi:hypothetical protein
VFQASVPVFSEQVLLGMTFWHIIQRAYQAATGFVLPSEEVVAVPVSSSPSDELNQQVSVGKVQAQLAAVRASLAESTNSSVWLSEVLDDLEKQANTLQSSGATASQVSELVADVAELSLSAGVKPLELTVPTVVVPESPSNSQVLSTTLYLGQ